MRMIFAGLSLALTLAACATAPAAPTEAAIAPAATPAAPPARATLTQTEIAAALADTHRPDADRARDADRKPADMLAFAGVHRGDRVGELLPGAGYFTRIFSAAVGPQGKVYAVLPNIPRPANAPPQAILSLPQDPAYANVTVGEQAMTALSFPEPLDVLWTSQNYHDLHLARLNIDVAAVNRAAFAALKPGGVYVVLDHAAVAGAPVTIADTLHRIDPAIVRREVEAAGFVFDGESNVLRNPADSHTVPVFDPSIRGHTDQFILRFRKPG